jgi:hypothetical protein
MASTKVIRTSNYFNNFPNALKIDWLNPPQLSPADCQAIANNLPCQIDQALQDYVSPQCSVNVDLKGSTVCIQHCAIGAFPYSFNVQFGQGLIMVDNAPDFVAGRKVAEKFPIHLTFNPPVKAIGTQIAISSSDQIDIEYFGILNVRMDSGNNRDWDYWQTLGVFNQILGSAPFIGAEAKAGKLISEAWFDAADANNLNNVPIVAINTLYIVP